MNIVVVNFGHSLTSRSIEWLRQHVGDFSYVHTRLRIDYRQPLQPQIVSVVNGVEEQLQHSGKPPLEHSKVYMVPAGMTDPSILLLLELYGRTGTLPSLLVLHKDESNYYSISESIDGEKFRLDARGRRRVQTLESAAESVS